MAHFPYIIPSCVTIAHLQQTLTTGTRMRDIHDRVSGRVNRVVPRLLSIIIGNEDSSYHHFPREILAQVRIIDC
jgi:hypothetical protein